MEHLPFCVFKRTGRAFYSVKYRNQNGEYDPAISTKQETKAAAIAVAYDWLKNGKAVSEGVKIALSVSDALNQIQTTAAFLKFTADKFRLGLLKGVVATQSKQDVDFPVGPKEYSVLLRLGRTSRTSLMHYGHHMVFGALVSAKAVI